MKRWANLLISLLLAVGASILLYPTVSNWIASRHHSRAIVDYAVTVEQLTGQQIEAQLAQARRYNQSLTGLVTEDAFAAGGSPESSEEYRSVLDIGGMIGYVSIPSIDVYLPVYHTVSTQVLRRGVGHLPESAFPIGGEGDHAVLTAHRGLPSAKLFTDLNKLEAGDRFYLHVLDRTLCYQVDQILVVEPYMVDALQPVPQEDHATLVTCTPYAINSHRLLVRGGRIEEAPEDDAVAELLEQGMSRDLWLLAGIGGLVLALLAVFLILRRRRKAKSRRKTIE